MMNKNGLIQEPASSGHHYRKRTCHNHAVLVCFMA